jgi:hypothetical protein
MISSIAGYFSFSIQGGCYGQYRDCHHHSLAIQTIGHPSQLGRGWILAQEFFPLITPFASLFVFSESNYLISFDAHSVQYVFNNSSLLD